MKYHANATLTVHQRRAMHDEFHEGASIKQLAARYHVATKTVQRWVHREVFTDRSSAPRTRRSKRLPGLKNAVLNHKKLHPEHGTRGTALRLRKYYPGLSRSRVRHILKVAGKIGPQPKKAARKHRPLPVGRHRAQMDIQQLPAIKGGSGFEYKISVIHMRTRIKYSEIHDDYRSETVADVLLSALDHLPPFRLIWTDNAMTFTMRFTAHPDRTTAFQDLVRSPDMIHGMCKPRSPWQNGIIERSHRTDNEELFHILKFHDSEERRYQLRLFEMYYAYERPHQGLSGHTPSEVYLRDYPMHAAARMINAPRPITYGFQGTS